MNLRGAPHFLFLSHPAIRPPYLAFFLDFALRRILGGLAVSSSLGDFFFVIILLMAVHRMGQNLVEEEELVNGWLLAVVGRGSCGRF